MIPQRITPLETEKLFRAVARAIISCTGCSTANQACCRPGIRRLKLASAVRRNQRESKSECLLDHGRSRIPNWTGNPGRTVTCPRRLCFDNHPGRGSVSRCRGVLRLLFTVGIKPLARLKISTKKTTDHGRSHLSSQAMHPSKPSVTGVIKPGRG